jgi:hypothetical protein
MAACQRLISSFADLVGEVVEIEFNGVAEKRGLAGDPRGGHFQATGSSILPLHRNMAGLPLMFAWPSARYFRERLSMHLNGCLRFDITVLAGVTQKIGQWKVRLHA